MLPNQVQDDAVSAADATVLDLSQLLGFRDLEGVGASEGEMAAALDAAHVKIGEGGIPGRHTEN